MTDTKTGTVLWYRADKGFGLISPKGGGADVWVHSTALAGSGYTALNEGQTVSYELTQGEKAPQAVNVKVV